LLVELKRVYPNDLPYIIDKLSSRKNRNCCRKVLEYELESESDHDKPEEIKEQVQVKKTLNSRQPKIEENHREK
jgi:hypothetical protein